MCLSSPCRVPFYHLGFEVFLFTQPKLSPNHTPCLTVLSQLLSETDILFSFLIYLLPFSLKIIHSEAVLLNIIYSMCSIWPGNSHVLNKIGWMKEWMSLITTAMLWHRYSIFSQFMNSQWNRDCWRSLSDLTGAEPKFKPRSVWLHVGSVQQSIWSIKKMCLYVAMV